MFSVFHIIIIEITSKLVFLQFFISFTFKYKMKFIFNFVDITHLADMFLSFQPIPAIHTCQICSCLSNLFRPYLADSILNLWADKRNFVRQILEDLQDNKSRQFSIPKVVLTCAFKTLLTAISANHFCLKQSKTIYIPLFENRYKCFYFKSLWTIQTSENPYSFSKFLTRYMPSFCTI
jgi:hypothetical protein